MVAMAHNLRNIRMGFDAGMDTYVDAVACKGLVA